jgi:hypothetical protein
MPEQRDPLFTSVAVYAALVARCERDPRSAAGSRLADAHAHWRERLRSPDAVELRAQYQEAYRRARAGEVVVDEAPPMPSAAPTPLVDAPPASAPTRVSAPLAPQPPAHAVWTARMATEVDAGREPSGFERYLARGDGIVAEALAFRDRCSTPCSGDSGDR